MSAVKGIFILLNFLLVQSEPPLTVDDWTITRNGNDPGVTLEGEERSWTISNLYIQESSQMDHWLLCETQSDQESIKGAIRFLSERGYICILEYLKTSFNGSVLPAIQDHGKIATSGKKPVYFTIVTSTLSVYTIHQAGFVALTKEMIAHIGIIYVILKAISHYETKISETCIKFHVIEIILKLHRMHFFLKATVKNYNHQTLCVPYHNTRQFLFQYIKHGNDEQSRISDVLKLLKNLLILSIPPLRAEPNSRLITEDWTALNWDTSLENEMKNGLIASAPEMLKKLCTYVLDKKNQPEWKEDYRKIIRYFKGVRRRGISSNWAKATAASKWRQTIDDLHRKNRKLLPSTWDYIHSLGNDIDSLGNDIQIGSDIFDSI